MRNLTTTSRWKKSLLFILGLSVMLPPSLIQARLYNNAIETEVLSPIVGAKKINPTTVEILFPNSQRMTLDFYGENIFRVFQDNSGSVIRDPQAKPAAQILVDNPRKAVSKLDLEENTDFVFLTTGKIKVRLDKKTSLLKVTNLGRPVVRGRRGDSPVCPTVLVLDRNHLTLMGEPTVLNTATVEVFLRILFQCQGYFPFLKKRRFQFFHYNSIGSNGYGMMWYTFKKGKYDFGASEEGKVKLSHESDYLDVFYMINDGAVALLNDFYQLTGNPVLLPKFGFYQGHLNAYNRDYWTENEKGILFEDGKRYKESQKDNGGIKESLNGEKNNYQFSARAVIDRYKNHDMPLGWLLPNDGYGAGYGQTETLDGNIQNLKSLGDYARQNGVEIGLWTQSDLHPKEGVSALLQRDIVKEVRDAGVRVLKTDVAWVGAGYSFGLNGVADVGHIMPYYGSDARPFIISLDGWAGTQRYAGIWSGDQTGGVWEYIRFHIPTYIGSGLSGQPNITSDMDGIFGGRNVQVNTRDFQWKTFTPMELNMDGWGANEKYPHALGEPATSINRWYLKLKSELMPYAYSIAKEAVDGMPMIRAMFLEYPNAYTQGTATQYQYLYGPYFLVAPIYQATKADEQGNDIRNGIYLPEGVWIDYFTGEKYDGNRILNNFAAPLWKLPVFVKNGAIIPLTNPNNNVNEIDKGIRIYELYPYGKSSFTEYDDDGVSEEYKRGKGVTTNIESEVGSKNDVTVTIHPAKGDFTGFVKEKVTEFRINVTSLPKKVTAQVGKKKVKLTKAASKDEFAKGENVFFYDEAPDLNRFATKGSEFEKTVITKNPQLLVKLGVTDITANTTTLRIEGFRFIPEDRYRITSGTLAAPVARVTADNTEAYTLKPTWDKVANADFYEIDFMNMLYTTIKDTELLFGDLTPETPYSFKIRAVNKDGASAWTEFGAATKSDPLEFAIRGIRGECTAASQGRVGVKRLFDFVESGDIWHSKYGEKAVPFELVMDLVTVNQLDKFHYLPRTNAGNGTLLKGTVSYSMNKEQWTEAGTFEWQRDDEVKVFNFTQHPTARYIKLSVTEAVGNYGSGKEIYVFKVPGTESYLQGDINVDGKIDGNDLTSYTNYTGLRKGDSDFEGYISNGDINKNGLIDAYDISVVATQLEGGVDNRGTEKVDGTIEISTSKQVYDKDEIIEIQVKGVDLRAVNAFSFALPYNQQDYEFVGVELQHMNAMENLTYDRLHSNGSKALYPTFVNVGNKKTLEGTVDLFLLKFKAKRQVKFGLKIIDGLLVDKRLNTRRSGVQ